MAKVTGEVLIEMLLAASSGESIMVGATQWTSLDDREFEVTACGDGGSRFVTLADDQVEVDPSAEFEVAR